MSYRMPSPLHVVREAQDDACGDFRGDLYAALSAPVRRISPKYFYDAQGSALFDAICEVPAYYPTRTELGILHRHAGDIAALAGPRAEVVEFGAGSLTKARVLLDALDRPSRFLPIDISGEHLQAAAARLQADYAGLEVLPVVGDYTQALQLPPRLTGAGRRVGFFPGSTIGNFTPEQAVHFLQMAARVLRGGALVLGADLVKDPAVLHAAYNDEEGVTAAFNLNLLARANRELGTDFDMAGFAHGAFYNSPQRRIEMHLVSRARQQVRLDGQTFSFEEGETLHTENSYKFSVQGMQALAEQAGFVPGPVWTDPGRLFSVHWLQSPS
jgi:dimethylhistidine N-methyltransferase